MDINYLQLAKYPACVQGVFKKNPVLLRSAEANVRGSCAAQQPSKNFSLNEKAACCITKFGGRIFANMHRRLAVCKVPSIK